MKVQYFIYTGFTILGALLFSTGCHWFESRKKATDVPSRKNNVPDSAETDTTVDLPTYRHFPDAASALRHILTRTEPSIIGFGEYHQQHRTAKIQSALRRFTEELLPVLEKRLSDLVVETWISTGGCGQKEQSLTKEVDQITKRPAATENETVTLIRKAAALGIKPHVLTLQCHDYEYLQTDAGVDYLALLELIGQRLGETAETAYRHRRQETAFSPSDKSTTLAIFGGAIHNDATPEEMWKTTAFGSKLKSLVKKYVEVDLIVPEFVENSDIAKQSPWFSIFEQCVSKKEAALVELGPDAYIIVFRKGAEIAVGKSTE